MEIRPAGATDIEFIASWTQDTFSWGDYVAERLPAWLEEENVAVLVADVDGLAVAAGSIEIVGPREAWAQGMRVHPHHRRHGLGTAVSERLWEWARRRDASVVRLAIEEDNDPAAGQATSMGFRRASQWWRGDRAVGEGSPVPEGNGGRRVIPPERLSMGPSAEAEPAFLSWTTGELARSSRGLAPASWQWRRLTPDHLVAAAKSRTLFEGRPGWAIGRQEEEVLDVEWIETTAEDAHAMALALVDRAVDGDATAMKVWTPDVDWLRSSLERLGFEFFGVSVWAMAL